MKAYNLVVFQWISKKLVTVGKILKRSFKWDQSGISNLKRLKVISKTRDIVQKRESFMACTNHPERNGNLKKGAPGIILKPFDMDYAWAGPPETMKKVAVILV